MSTRSIHTLVATACLIVVTAAGAQMPPAPQGMPDAAAQAPRPPADGPRPGDRPGAMPGDRPGAMPGDRPGAMPPPMPPRGRAAPRPMDASQPTATVTGKVRQLLVNPNGEVDGLLLDDGTQIGVAPHLSASLTQAIRPNDNVEVTGSQAPGGSPMRATSIRNTASGRSVVDQADDGRTPPAPRRADALIAMSASGRVAQLLRGPMGETNGVVLDSGAAVRFPPRAAEGLDLRAGAPLYAVGYGTRNALGSSLEATRLGATLETTRETFGPAPGRPDTAGPDAPPMRPKPPMERPPARRAPPAAGQTPPPAGDMPAPPARPMPRANGQPPAMPAANGQPPAMRTPNARPPAMPPADAQPLAMPLANGQPPAMPGQAMSPPMPPAASSPR